MTDQMLFLDDCDRPKDTKIEMANDNYIQDTRAVVGNSISWWRKGRNGYTCDVKEAHIFTKKQAMGQHVHWATDKPWPRERTSTPGGPATIDIQTVLWDEEAFKGKLWGTAC